MLWSSLPPDVVSGKGEASGPIRKETTIQKNLDYKNWTFHMSGENLLWELQEGAPEIHLNQHLGVLGDLAESSGRV